MATPSVTGSIVTTTAGTSGATSASVALTVASVTHPMLIVLINNVNGNVLNADWNGTPMTRILSASGGAGEDADAFYLLNPAVGSFNITANWGGTVFNIGMTAFLLQDAQSIDVINHVSGSNTTASVTLVTTQNNELVLEWVIGDGVGVTQTQGAGQTELSNFDVGSSFNIYSSSSKVATTAGSYSMSVDFTKTGPYSSDFLISVFSVSDIAAAGSFVPQTIII